MSVPTTIEEYERIQVFTMKISLAEYHRTFKTVKDPMGFFRTQRLIPLKTETELEIAAREEEQKRQRLKTELRSEIAKEMAESFSTKQPQTASTIPEAAQPPA
jgi:hypothetical protein